MAVNEQIVTGRKFRKCIDVANKVWLRISFWTSANDVEFDDGKTLQQKLGTFSGLTDSLASADTKYALTAAAGKVLNDKLEQTANNVLTLTNNVSTLTNNISTLNSKISNLSFVVLTQEQYDALPVKDAGTLYFIRSN